MTQGKRGDEAIGQSEEWYKAVVENANDAIYLVDVETGRIIAAHPAMAAIYRYTPEELVELRVLDLHFPEAPQEATEVLRHSAQGQTVVREFWTKRKDGAGVWVEVKPVLVELGGKRFAISVTRDITERKRLEEELRASEQKYRDLVQNAFDIILSADSEGNIVEANQKMTDVLGYSRDQFMHMKLQEVTAPEDVEAFESYRQALIERACGAGLQVDWITRNGHRLPMEINSTVRYGQSGALVTTRCIVRDVSERKRLEQYRIESEKLRAVTEMAAGAAHNFNNMLSVILLRAQLIERAPNNPAAVLPNVQGIIKAAEDAVAIAHRLQAPGQGSQFAAI